jgi:hypothetical protein
MRVLRRIFRENCIKKIFVISTPKTEVEVNDRTILTWNIKEYVSRGRLM